MGTSMSRITLTPWSRDGLRAAEINRFALAGQMPEGWWFNGFARSAHGPFTFSVRQGSGESRAFVAVRVSDIPAAIERLLTHVADESLLERLTASVEALA